MIIKHLVLSSVFLYFHFSANLTTGLLPHINNSNNIKSSPTPNYASPPPPEKITNSSLSNNNDENRANSLPYSIPMKPACISVFS